MAVYTQFSATQFASRPQSGSNDIAGRNAVFGARNVQIRLPQRFHRHAYIRIHPPGHILHFADRGQWLRLVQIVHGGEILIERRKNENGQIQPRCLHRQIRVRICRLLLLILDLRLDHVAMRRLARPFQLLRDLQKTPRLFQRLLRGCVLPLRHHQRVVSLGNGYCQSPAGDLRLGCRDRFCRCARL